MTNTTQYTPVYDWDDETLRTIDNMTLEALTLCLERQEQGKIELDYCNEYWIKE